MSTAAIAIGDTSFDATEKTTGPASPLSTLRGSTVDNVALMTAVEAMQEEVREARTEAHRARYLFLDLQRRVYQYLFGEKGSGELGSTSNLASEAENLVNTTTTLADRFHQFEGSLLDRLSSEASSSRDEMKEIAETAAAAAVDDFAADLRETLHSYRLKISDLEKQLVTQKQETQAAHQVTRQIQLFAVSSRIDERQRFDRFRCWMRWAAERKKARTAEMVAKSEMLCERRAHKNVRVTYFSNWQRAVQLRKQREAAALCLRMIDSGLRRVTLQKWQVWARSHAKRSRVQGAAAAIAQHTSRGRLLLAFRKWMEFRRRRVRSLHRTQLAESMVRNRTLGSMYVAWGKWRRYLTDKRRNQSVRRRRSLHMTAAHMLRLAEHTPSALLQRYFSQWVSRAHTQSVGKLRRLSHQVGATSVQLDDTLEAHKSHISRIEADLDLLKLDMNTSADDHLVTLHDLEDRLRGSVGEVEALVLAQKEGESAVADDIRQELQEISIREGDRDARLDALLRISHPLAHQDVLLCLRDWVEQVETRQSRDERRIEEVLSWVRTLEEELRSLRIVRPKFK